MIQLPFYLGLFALGALFNLAVGPRRDGPLVAALAFPCGLALWVLSALAAIGAGLPLGPPLGLAILGGEIALFAAVALRRGVPEKSVLRPIAIWAAVFAVAAAILSSFSLAKFSADSHQILRLANLLGQGAPLDETVVGYLSDRGVFTIASYAASDVVGAPFFYALAPVVGISLAGLFAVCAFRMASRAGAAPRATWILVALTLAALVTAFMPAYHFLYVHMNQGSALYLLAFVALVWLAEANQDAATLPPAFLSLAAFALHRVEAPVFAALFAVCAFYPGRMSRRQVAPAFAAYAIFVSAWMLRFGASAPAESEFMSSGRAAMLAAGTAACFAGWLVATAAPLRRLGALVPAALALLVLAGLFAAFAMKHAHMVRSADALAANVLGLRAGGWGITWWMVAAATVLALFLPRLPAGRGLFLAVAIAVALTLLLAYGRIPYRIGLGDSANRMFVHYLPLAMLYLVVKFAPHMRGGSPRPPAPAARP